MKKTEKYIKRPYKMVIIPDSEEGGFAVSYPDLPGCISTGETIEEAIRNAEDAKKEWIKAAIEENIAIPDPSIYDPDSYSGQFKIRIPKSLHRDLSLHAKEEGISMNQYCLYLLSRNDR